MRYHPPSKLIPNRTQEARLLDAIRVHLGLKPDFKFKPGDWVEKGDVIGQVGRTRGLLK